MVCTPCRMGRHQWCWARTPDPFGRDPDPCNCVKCEHDAALRAEEQKDKESK
jgi:hypothetical protein